MKIVKIFTLILFFVVVNYGYCDSQLLKGIVEYKPLKDRNSVYGVLNCKGSTNVEKLLKIWLPQFQKLYPNVKSSVDFRGSGQGIKALMDASANIGAASRKIKKSEYEQFIQLRGYPPLEIKVSLDALAIYVNRMNKIDEITLDKLDAIFSSTLNRKYSHKIENWKELTGVDRKINIYLYDRNSGTRSYFRKKVMLKGEFNLNNIISDQYTQLSEVINEVSNDKNGICFGSVGSRNFKVKVLSLAKRAYFPYYKPNKRNIIDGKYPLTRYFYIYLDVPPDKEIPKFLYEFCKFILSKDGQNSVIKTGGLPLSPQQIGIELSKLRR